MCAQCVLEVMVPTSCYVAEPSKVMQVTREDAVTMEKMHTTIETLFSSSRCCHLRIFVNSFKQGQIARNYSPVGICYLQRSR
jgi:hypothetical protein